MWSVLQVEVGQPDLQLGPRVINARLSRRLLASEARQMRSRLISVPARQLELSQTQECIRRPR